MENKEDKIADAFYNEDYKELERLTGIKANSQKEFEELNNRRINKNDKYNNKF